MVTTAADSSRAHKWGATILGLATIAFGALSWLQQDFLMYWQPAPEVLPFRRELALVIATALMISGAGLLSAVTARISALVLAALYIVFAAWWSPRVLGFPHLIGTWLGCCEQAALGLGALSVWAQGAGDRFQRPPYPQIASAVFGAFSIVFGLSHWISLNETIAMIPEWIPGDRGFWAISTGVVHVSVGAVFVFQWRVALASRIAAAMYLAFALLVWTPAALQRVTDWLQWSGVVVTVALAGAIWALGDYSASSQRARASGHV